MKDIKNYLVGESQVTESQSYNFKDIKYTMISYYKASEPLAFLIEDISEINDIYHDWDFKDEEVEKIIGEVKNLNANECYIHKSGENDFEVISRIK